MNLLSARNRSAGVVIAWVLMLGAVLASKASADCTEPLTAAEQNRRATYVTLAGAGVITAWGVVNWDYFSRKPQAKSEGWFGPDTKEGGADKLGHVFTTYVVAQGISSLMEQSWCFTPEEAAWHGALSSFAILGFMEAGDSFSDYGFSSEDFIANALGSLASYYRYRHPDLARKVDLRWEIGLHPEKMDFTTDYENSKYLVAVKLNGFERFDQSLLKHVELHAGYYARGYSDANESDQRNLYMGIGLNLTDLFRRGGHRRVATFLNYYQPPATYLAIEKQLTD
ncbi:MAG: DUF2279 domain-containing protein [Desulfuromonadales bacterium]|nr:DUF2279 domain-containing protein [Desulfuromonadales bacterium]